MPITGWPLPRHREIPRYFPNCLWHSFHVVVTRVIHPNSITTQCNALSKLLYYTTTTLLPITVVTPKVKLIHADKISPRHFPDFWSGSWHFPDSCQIPRRFPVFQTCDHPDFKYRTVLHSGVRMCPPSRWDSSGALEQFWLHDPFMTQVTQRLSVGIARLHHHLND